MLLGIDIGGSKTVVVLGRADGEILAESRLDDWSTGSSDKDVALIIEHGSVLLRGCGIEASDLQGVGISAPGPLNPKKGTIVDAPNLPGWHDVPIVERLYEAFRIPVVLENDANAAALAEWRYGAGQGTRNFAFLTMSTGIGGGFVIDGHLHRGGRFAAGEIGHMPIVPNGRKCRCGLTGCLEAYAGGWAIAERVREDLLCGERSNILDFAGGDPKDIQARHWVEAIREGDRYALALKEEFSDCVAQGMAIVMMAMDPEVIALGTIVQHNTDLFIDELYQALEPRIWEVQRDVRLEPAKLGPRLPSYAALSVAAIEPIELR